MDRSSSVLGSDLDSYDSEGKYIGRGATMANGEQQIGNGRPDLMKIFELVARFLILPMMWLMYQMYLDVGAMKVQMARVEGRIENHQAVSAQQDRDSYERRALESECSRLRDELERARGKR